MTLLHARPIARVNVISTANPILPDERWEVGGGCEESGALLLIRIVDGGELDDFHFADTAGDLNFHRVADLLSEESLADGGSGGDEALGDVGLLAGDQLVLDLFVFCEIHDRDRGVEANAVARDAR